MSAEGPPGYEAPDYKPPADDGASSDDDVLGPPPFDAGRTSYTFSAGNPYLSGAAPTNPYGASLAEPEAGYGAGAYSAGGPPSYSGPAGSPYGIAGAAPPPLPTYAATQAAPAAPIPLAAAPPISPPGLVFSAIESGPGATNAAAAAAAAPNSATHVSLILSGPHGVRGADGPPGQPSQPGMPGIIGTDGMPACPNSDVYLSAAGPSILVRYVYFAGANGNVDMTSTLAMGNVANALFLEARGGNGGNGGNGGWGGIGIDGRPGAPANRMMRGGDGENGYPGGNGGDAGSGGRPGDGGHMRLSLDDTDLDLLLLLKCPANVNAGVPGNPGSPGQGQRGGIGGPGGPAYHWTTHSGVGQNRRTYHHTSPAGHPGRDGQPGAHGRPGFTSPPARPGTFGIFLKTATGAIAGPFTAPFVLTVTGAVELADELGFGVAEPGARITARFMVANHGETPSPLVTDIRIWLEPNEWVDVSADPPASTTLLPRGILSRATAPVQLSFRVRVPNGLLPVAMNQPLSTTGRMAPKAASERSGLPLEALCAQSQPFAVRYPVALSKPAFTTAVTRGEDASMVTVLTNNSLRPIGAASSSGRALRVWLILRTPSDARPAVTRAAQLAAADMCSAPRTPQAVTPLPLSAFSGDGFPLLGFEVQDVPPGGAVTIAATVGFADHTLPDYAVAHLAFVLELGALAAFSMPLPIQAVPMVVQLTEGFAYAEGVTKALLLINAGTSLDEVRRWRAQAAFAWGSEAALAVWNVSLHRGFGWWFPSLKGGGPGGPGTPGSRNIGELFRGRLVIALNNEFVDANLAPGMTTVMRTCVTYQDLINAFAVFGARLYVVSPTRLGLTNPAQRLAVIPALFRFPHKNLFFRTVAAAIGTQMSQRESATHALTMGDAGELAGWAMMGPSLKKAGSRRYVVLRLAGTSALAAYKGEKPTELPEDAISLDHDRWTVQRDSASGVVLLLVAARTAATRADFLAAVQWKIEAVAGAIRGSPQPPFNALLDSDQAFALLSAHYDATHGDSPRLVLEYFPRPDNAPDAITRMAQQLATKAFGGAATDPKLQPAGVPAAVSGELTMAGHETHKKTKAYFFALRGSELCFYDKPDAKKAKDSLNVEVITQLDPGANEREVHLVTPETSVFLQADSLATIKRWVAALQPFVLVPSEDAARSSRLLGAYATSIKVLYADAVTEKRAAASDAYDLCGDVMAGKGGKRTLMFATLRGPALALYKDRKAESPLETLALATVHLQQSAGGPDAPLQLLTREGLWEMSAPEPNSPDNAPLSRWRAAIETLVAESVVLPRLDETLRETAYREALASSVTVVGSSPVEAQRQRDFHTLAKAFTTLWPTMHPQLRALPTNDKIQVVCSPVSRIDPAFSVLLGTDLSPGARYALAKALPFTEKCIALRARFAIPTEVLSPAAIAEADVLIAAILSDLVDEQVAFRSSVKTGPLKDAVPSMQLLGVLCSMDFGIVLAMGTAAPLYPRLVRGVVVVLLGLSAALTKTKDKMLRRRGAVVSKATKSWLERFAARVQISKTKRDKVYDLDDLPMDPAGDVKDNVEKGVKAWAAANPLRTPQEKALLLVALRAGVFASNDPSLGCHWVSTNPIGLGVEGVWAGTSLPPAEALSGPFDFPMLVGEVPPIVEDDCVPLELRSNPDAYRAWRVANAIMRAGKTTFVW